MPIDDQQEEAEDFKCRGGRPPKEIEADSLRKLRAMQCTDVEIAAFFGVSTRTLYRRIKVEPWKGAWEDGISEGKLSLRRLQWSHAQMANSAGVSMTIHLSKHWLGEHDKTLNLNVPIDDLDKAIEELEQRKMAADRREPTADAGVDRQATALPGPPSSTRTH